MGNHLVTNTRKLRKEFLMDNKAIETLSVNAVKNSIVMSEYLDQYIPDNDKEPSWDGAVYIYKNKSKEKCNLKGRMPVQVKGKECDDHSKKEISYLMSIVDLKNYLYDGGCILFVVYIGNKGLTTKIYYAELTPVKLRQLLEKAKNKNKKTIYLKEFPTDGNKKATIFLNCYQNCKKQSSFTEGKLFTIEELEQQGVLENLVIPFEGIGVEDLQMALIKNEVYLYAKVKGSSVPQPLYMIPKNIQTQEVIDALITIEDKIFYTTYRIIKNANGIIFCYGESFTISCNEEDKTCKIKYKNSDKIRVLARDLEFMLTYLDKGYFKVNDVTLPFEYKSDNSSELHIDEEKKHLKWAQDIVKVLDILGCNDDIDINDMKKEDWRNLDRLRTAFLDKKPVSGLKENLPPVMTIKIGKLRFAVCLKKCSKKNTYEIYDFFKTDINVAIKDKNNGNMLPVSQFDILHENDFLTLSNIDFDVLAPSFKQAEHHYETFNCANFFLLELLNAYDKASGARKKKIMGVCKEFCDWINTAPENELSNEIKTLNVLQTVKRQRDLDIEEVSSLYDIIESGNASEACVVGAYLLVDQQQRAELHFSRLTKMEQSNFKKFPIYHFWKK